jgi:hypothetical protein
MHKVISSRSHFEAFESLRLDAGASFGFVDVLASAEGS